MRGLSVAERRDRILGGSIIKTIITLAWPIMVGNTLHTAYNMADTFWLGKVSKEAVAATTTSWPIMFLFISLGMGLSTAGVSLVSQNIGADRQEKADKAASQVFGLIFLISLIIGVIAFVGNGWLLDFVVGTPAAVFPLANSYLSIISLTMPLIFIYIAFRFILRGIGDMKTPMYILAISVALNAMVDPFIILGIGPFPALGVTGAAISSAIARTVASLVGMYLLFKGRVDIKVSLKEMVPEMDWVKKIFTISGPATIARAGSALGFIALMSLVSVFGSVVISAYGIGSKVFQLINITIWGFAGSSMTMVGQNIGAGNHDRAERIVYRALGLAGVIMFSIAGLVYLGRSRIISIFINNPEVIRTGSEFIAIFIFSIPFFGFFRILDSTYRGTGHTKSAMVLSLTRLWVLRVGISYLLAFSFLGVGLKLGFVGLWWGMAISNILGASLSFAWFLTGKWKEKTIDEDEKPVT